MSPAAVRQLVTERWSEIRALGAEIETAVTRLIGEFTSGVIGRHHLIRELARIPNPFRTVSLPLDEAFEMYPFRRTAGWQVHRATVDGRIGCDELIGMIAEEEMVDAVGDVALGGPAVRALRRADEVVAVGMTPDDILEALLPRHDQEDTNAYARRLESKLHERRVEVALAECRSVDDFVCELREQGAITWISGG
ncbi:hypothetical protein [Leifsonia sp. Leaf264]|uniref:hypothetical protein n=1 Tax=Leifsonia sp. Leaf264 TaxID=1736314 RepID=UPI000701C31C|nr:hypothetical protein [Leifsonia sp. Leaf264]KQP01447.1 hypothetical protein ASF30_02180 [Leifsonia sp. Leaf264]